jgi:glutathione-regulated potassium-efflux system ancillary protein KefF
VALHGKTCLWVATTGAPGHGYTPQGMHHRPFADFVPPIEQTARFCGMHWAPPVVVFGAQRIGHEALTEHGQRYREQLLALTKRQPSAPSLAVEQGPPQPPTEEQG